MERDFFKKVSYLKETQHKEHRYWSAKLAGDLEKSHFPYPANDSFLLKRMEALRFEIPEQAEQRLLQISNRSDARLHVLLSSFVALLLRKYTGHRDILIGTSPYRQIRDEEAEPANNSVLPLRVHVDEGLSLSGLAAKMKQTISEAVEHQNYPVQLMFEDAKQSMDALDVAVVLDNVQDRFMNQTESPFNFIFEFSRERESIQASIVHNASVYNRQAANDIASHFVALLGETLDDPQRSLDSVSMLTAEDREIIGQINDTDADFPAEAVIHRLFADRAEAHPDKPALVCEGTGVSYRELHERSNRVAHYLRSFGVGAESKVVLIVPPSIEMIVGMMAILKAGGAYVPIDPELPPMRQQYIIQDCDAHCILSLQQIKVPSASCKRLDIDDAQARLFSDENLEQFAHSRQLAYIIYTSGTTGNPKGVAVEHRNVVRLLFNDRHPFDFTDRDVWTMFHSFGFDFSVWEIFGALLTGGKLVLVPSEIRKDYSRLLKLLQREKVTILNQTPSSFYQMQLEESGASEQALSLRCVIFGGEALTPSKLTSWRQRYPSVRLVNMYGITETTVHNTFKEITEEEMRTNESRIGVPIPTVRVYVMNRQLELLPVGVVGELWIGGEGVARGYVNLPELTAERFQTRLVEGRTERLYRTGDLGRYGYDGEIEYLGRADKQIKIRGFRVEPDEIEAHLRAHEHIQEAVVIARSSEGADKKLCAYVVVREGAAPTFDSNEIRRFLHERISEHMVPAFIVPIPAIPLTINGKTDHAELMKIEPKQTTKQFFAAPGTEMEKRIFEVWKAVLGTEQFGIHSTVFDIGGTSFDILAISRLLSDTLEQEVPVVKLFTYPTIAMLAKSLARSDAAPLQADAREALLAKGKLSRMQKLKKLKE